MNVFLSFSISLIFLIVAADILVKCIERFASKIKLSPLVIGATLIAIGTSLPETFVAFSSLAQNVPNVSMGDIIGSNIVNVSLILGLAILLFPVRIGTEKTQRNNLILLLLTVFFTGLFFLPESIRKPLTLLLLGFYAVFMIAEIVWGEVGSKKEDKKALSKMEKTHGKPVFYFAGISLSLLGLIISSRYLVSSAIEMSKIFNIDAEVVGLSIVAIGTSLPELITTIVSGIKKDWKLIYGDIQGSNIYNLSVIGTIMIIFGNGNSYYAHMPSIYYMLTTTAAIFILTGKYKGTYIPRLYGLFFLLSYVIYLKLIYP